MNKIEFEEIVKNRCNDINEILTNKAKEYAKLDRLHNFKEAGRILNITPEEALKGMTTKHTICINDMIEDCKYNNFDRPIEYVKEKIGDEINYLILLEALLTERIKNKEHEHNNRQRN